MTARARSKEPNFLKSRLRLFLSVDLVGSTAFKQKALVKTPARERGPKSISEKPGGPPVGPWLKAVTTFYREIDRLFQKEWNHLSSQKSDFPLRLGEPPMFWKALGDELLYSKIISHHTEVLACLYAWAKALKQYRSSIKEKYPSLSVKSSAWLAGFPVNNSEVVLSTSDAFDEEIVDDDDSVFANMRLLDKWHTSRKKIGVLDFVGPSIDTGFRIGTLSTPRRMAISLDLALMLVTAQWNLDRDHCPYEPLRIFYAGRSNLKGVLDGKPYPVFWVDLEDKNDLNESEDRLSGIDPAGNDQGHIKQFCEKFIKDNEPVLNRPYIPDLSDDSFSIMPPRHAEMKAALVAYWNDQTTIRREETKSQKQMGNEPSIDNPDTELFSKIIDHLVLRVQDSAQHNTEK